MQNMSKHSSCCCPDICLLTLIVAAFSATSLGACNKVILQHEEPTNQFADAGNVVQPIAHMAGHRWSCYRLSSPLPAKAAHRQPAAATAAAAAGCRWWYVPRLGSVRLPPRLPACLPARPRTRRPQEAPLHGPASSRQCQGQRTCPHEAAEEAKNQGRC